MDYGQMSASEGTLGLAGLAFDPPTLTLGQSAPDPEPLVVLESVLKTLGAYLATPADPFGLPGGTALLREERLRIRLRAERTFLPAQVLDIFRTDDDVR
jgi:hypothetical protein